MSPSIVETEAVDGEQFEIIRAGYGTFEIPITIFFNPETGLQPLTVNHYLDFKNGGKAKDYEFEIADSFMK